MSSKLCPLVGAEDCGEYDTKTSLPSWDYPLSSREKWERIFLISTKECALASAAGAVAAEKRCETAALVAENRQLWGALRLQRVRRRQARGPPLSRRAETILHGAAMRKLRADACDAAAIAAALARCQDRLAESNAACERLRGERRQLVTRTQRAEAEVKRLRQSIRTSVVREPQEHVASASESAPPPSSSCQMVNCKGLEMMSKPADSDTVCALKKKVEDQAAEIAQLQCELNEYRAEDQDAEARAEAVIKAHKNVISSLRSTGSETPHAFLHSRLDDFSAGAAAVSHVSPPFFTPMARAPPWGSGASSSADGKRNPSVASSSLPPSGRPSLSTTQQLPSEAASSAARCENETGNQGASSFSAWTWGASFLLPAIGPSSA